jgi:hypothetical protein
MVLPEPSTVPLPEPTGVTCPTPATLPGMPSKADVEIDFGVLQFPPLVPKLGVNSVWNESKDATRKGLLGAAAANMSIGSGLLELSVPRDQNKGNSSLGPPAIFERDRKGNVQVQSNQNLNGLRTETRNAGLINFLQLAGTPADPKLFNLEPTLASISGNFYPLPIRSQRSEYANALARFVQLLVTGDLAPTIVAFWQEPAHTLGLSEPTPSGRPNAADSERNLNDFIDFYDSIATEIRKLNSDLPLGTFQLNASQGIGTNGIDGAEYLPVVELLLRKEAALGRRIPMDYFTLQNYKGTATAEIIQNARFSIMNGRFANVPIMMNEFQPSKTGTNDDKFNSSAGLIDFVRSIKFTLDQADVSHLVTSDVVTQSNKFRINTVLNRIGSLPLKRVQVASAASSLVGIASASDNEIAAVIWNQSKDSVKFSLGMLNLPAVLNNSNDLVKLEVLKADGSPNLFSIASHKIANAARIDGISLLPNEILFLSNTVQPIKQNDGLLFLRHNSFFMRVDPLLSPLTTSAYDIRRNALVLATGSEADPAFSSVIFAPRSRTGTIPAANRLVLKIRKFSSIGAKLPELFLRLDFLTGNESKKSIFVGAASGSFQWSAPGMPDWIPAIVGPSEVASSNSGNETVTIDLAKEAPADWGPLTGSALPRLQLSGVLRGDKGGALADIELAVE